MRKCEALSRKRDQLLQNAWAIAPDGSIVTKSDDHAWGDAATPADLNKLAGEIMDQVTVLNGARLLGFIKGVMANPGTDSVDTRG